MRGIHGIHSTGHQIRNKNTGDTSWVSHFGQGAFYTMFSITAPEFLVSCKCQPGFLITLFLIGYPVLLITVHDAGKVYFASLL